MKNLLLIIITLLLCAFACTEKKSEVKDIKPKAKSDSVVIKKLKPIVITDSIITYFKDKENSFQKHTYFVDNYRIVFNNLLLNSSEPIFINNSVEIWQNDKCLFLKCSDFTAYDKESKDEYEKSKLDIIKNSKKVSKTEKAYEIEAKGHFQASYFLEQIGDIYKTGIPYVIINSNHNGGNAGGSDLLVFELGDTIRKVLDIFAHYGEEDSEYDIKDIDGDSTPEIIYGNTFQYTRDDCALMDLYFIKTILKFRDGNYHLYTQKMKKAPPNQKELNKIMVGIYDDNYEGYIMKRNLYYAMIDLAYSGNKASAFKLMEMTCKKYKIKLAEFKKYFDERLEEYKETDFYVDF